MIKVKMLYRHNGPNGKMEQGLTYLLPQSFAQELVAHGLAEVVASPMAPPVNVVHKPPKTKAMDTAMKEMRAKNQAVINKPKKGK